MKKVSVIMPTYNCAKYLDESIPSVLGQSYENVELIVIDNGSTDDTENIVSKYLKNPRVTYIKEAVKNVSAARNLGIKKAKGELIAFLDADDIFLENKIQKQVEQLIKNNRFGFSYTNEIYFKKDAHKGVLSTYYHFSGDIFYFLKRNDFIHTSTVIVRREILEEGLFDESLTSHEDWDLFLRLAFKGIRFFYVNEALSKVRVRDFSATTDTYAMDTTRRVVGLRARQYWKDFKSSMRFFSLKGQMAIARYLKFKIYAFLIGFPKRECFNKPVPQQLLR